MKHLLFFFIPFFITISVYSQEFLSYSKEDIKEMFLNIDSNFYFIEKDSSDLLYVNFDGIAKSRSIYFFDDNNLCDSIVMRYYCSECAGYYLYNYVSSLNTEWISISENKYLSNLSLRIQLIGRGEGGGSNTTSKILNITKTPNEEICMTLFFSKITLDTDIWVEKTKKETVIDSFPVKNCKKYFKGTWGYSDTSKNELIIERKLRHQIEYENENNYYVAYKIKWLDKCSYEMTVTSFESENPKKHKIGAVTTVKILEINNDSMKYKAYNWHSEHTSKLIRIE